MREESRHIPVITLILIVINVIVFFVETIMGGSENVDVALKFGAAYTPYIIEDGQWYRLFTSMFLHFGIEHLASNMIALIAIGQYVEFYFGRIRFIIIYVVSGICGNLLSMMMEFFTLKFSVSAGASGAISGLLAIMVIFVIDPVMRKYFSLGRVIVCIVLMLVPGFLDGTVDGYAHLGGFIAGLLVGLIMYLFRRKDYIEMLPEDSEYEIVDGDEV